MELALSIKKTPRVHYRLGRFKEESLKQYGIDHLFQSVLLNPSSFCSNRWLKETAAKREIKLKTNTRKLLTDTFNNSEVLEHLKTINQLLINGSVKLPNNSILLASVAFTDFIAGLNADEKLFGIQTTNDNDEEDDYGIDISSIAKSL